MTEKIITQRVDPAEAWEDPPWGKRIVYVHKISPEFSQSR